MDLRLLLPSKPLLLLLSPSKPYLHSQPFSRRLRSRSRTEASASNLRRLRLRVACSLHSEINAVERIIDSDHEPEPKPKDEGFVSGSSDSTDPPPPPPPPPSVWKQMKEIALFAGPATGLWICGPLMSLIDTMVIGQSSSLELAALGPGTVFCDNLSYIFMFLSIATSNMVATLLAKEDKNLAQHQISMLLFVAFACGWGMFLFTKLLGVQMLSGMKDSWGPLKALAVASAINGIGDVLLCCVCGYGIAGAAWATMVSQVVAAFMMMKTLNNTGFRAFQLSIPSPGELLEIFEISAPVFLTMTSKVVFYSLLTYFATSMGTITLAAHQVMINIYCMCTVWGEPLSQTAQSFMPELIHGVNRSFLKARMLLKSLVVIGAISGLTLGVIGTSFPWFFPHFFTSDSMVAGEMHKVVVPYFIALMVTPSTHSLEGTLMASRDLRFLSLSMTGCLCFGGLLLLFLSSRGGTLSGCWWGLAVFQWARFLLALQRLVSPRGTLYRDDSHQHELVRAKAT